MTPVCVRRGPLQRCKQNADLVYVLVASMNGCARRHPPGSNQLVTHDLVLQVGYLDGHLPVYVGFMAD